MFNNLKIGKKLMIGFGSVLGLLVIVGAAAFFGLIAASYGFKAYREMARDTNLAGRLQANMLMVRMNVKDFIIMGSDEGLRRYRDYVEKMTGFLKTAQVEIQDPERAQKIDLVEEHIKDYKNAFNKLIELKKQRNDYVHDTLNVIGPEMEQNLTKIMVSANRDQDMVAAYHTGMALRNLLLARLYVTKFLDTNAQKDADRVASEFAAFQETITVLHRELQNPERKELLKEVLELERNYVQTFNNLTRLIFQRNGLISGTLDRIGPLVASNVEDVKLDIKAVQDRLGPELVASNRNSLIVISVVILAAIGIGVFLAIFLTRGITEPLYKGVAFARIVEQGDLTCTIDVHQQDEVGALADAMRNMVSNLKDMVDQAEQIADGNLTVEVKARSEKDVLAHALQTMVKNLANIVAETNSAATQVASGSQQLASGAQSMAQGATEQASSLEEISSSMTEIESQTKQNADNARQANQFVADVRNSADSGSQQMAEMVTAMNEINESSQSISKIIKVIDEIAFQTNLLALNAAVEAARAGAHGKGFAVVAEEVRNLASRSAEAARETSDLIEGAVKKAESGSEISRRTEKALGEIVTSVTKVSDLVGEISAASIEQSEGVSQVTKGLQQIDNITQQNSAHAEESASSAEELASQAELLRQSISSLKISEDDASGGSLQHQENTNAKNNISAQQPQFNHDRNDGAAVPKIAPKQGKIIMLDDSEFGKYA